MYKTLQMSYIIDYIIRDMVDVSIIMGVYNCEKYLKESIDSIINQTFNNWELIMCDDGSTDNTYVIGKKYADSNPQKIKILKNETNKGLNYTLNRCLKEAKGKYIARQDGDDISDKNRLKIEFDFLENNKEYVLVSSNMIYFDENGEYGMSNMKEKPDKYDFVKGSPFCHAPCMIRKNIIQKVNGYTVDKKLLRVEDYHLWFKVYEKGYKGYNIQEPLYKMRNDIEATKRRTWSNRINEARVKIIGYRMLNISWIYYIYALIPLIKGVVPQYFYIKIYKNKFRKNNKGDNDIKGSYNSDK